MPRPPIARAALVLALLSCTMLMRTHQPKPVPPPPPPPPIPVPQEVIAPAWAVDVRDTPEGKAFSGKRLEVPGEPLKGQKKPPCEASYVALNGGCWVRVEAKPKPDCPSPFWRHRDSCYLPVQARADVPTSLGE